MSILSAGVHSPYAKYAEDPELSQGSYSIKNAADAGGFYNDIFLDVFAERWEGYSILHKYSVYRGRELGPRCTVRYVCLNMYT